MLSPIFLTTTFTCLAVISSLSSVEATSSTSNRQYHFQLQGQRCCTAFVSGTNPCRSNYVTATTTATKNRNSKIRCSPFAPLPLITITTPTATTTNLQMGIRSFLRNNLAKEENDDDDDNDEEDPSVVREALEAIRADLEAVELMDDTKRRSRSTPTRSVEDDNADKDSAIPVVTPPRRTLSSPSPSPPTYEETVKQRIQRLRSGSMTENEKVQFLQTALSSKDGGKEMAKTPATDTSKKSRNMRRGKNSKGKDGLSVWDVIGSGRGKSSKSSPGSVYGKESRGSGGVGVSVSGGEMSDSAKRDYLAMVTDPNRFQSYAIVRGQSKAPGEIMTEEVDKKDDEVVVVPTTGSITTAPQVDNEEKRLEDMESATITNDSSITEETDTDSGTLATRLEEDAILREKSANEAKVQREQERVAEAERLIILQREMEVERHRLEEERIERERLEREEKERALEKARREEEERMEKVIAAQDAYWKKKLEEETKFEGGNVKDEKVAVEKKRDEETTPNGNGAVVEGVPSPVPEAVTEVTSLPLPIPASDATPVEVPLPVKKKDSSFIREQERKRAETEQKKAEYREKVKSMNSPIPSTPSPLTPVIPFTSTKVVSPPLSPPPSFSQLLATGKKSPAIDVKPTSTATETPPLSQSDGAKSQSSTESSDTPPLSEMKTVTTTTTPPESDSATSLASLTSSRMSLLSQLNRGKQAVAGDIKPATTTTSPSNLDSTASSSLASPTDGVIGEQNRRIIRQQVPLGDDDDFDEFARGGSNENLSLKEIMARQKLKDTPKDGDDDAAKREKSKKFGINLDKLYPS